MLTLYATSVSHYCAKVRIVLEAKGLACEVIPPPGGPGSKAYRRLVPQGVVPALETDDGIISESEAINEYLEEIAPEPSLLPGSPAERARQRYFSRFHDLALEPALRALFPFVHAPVRVDAEVDRLAGQFEARLRQLDDLADYRPFLASSTLSLADVGYPATLALGEIVFDHFRLAFPTSRSLAAYREVLAEHHAVSGPLAIATNAARQWVARRAA